MVDEAIIGNLVPNQPSKDVAALLEIGGIGPIDKLIFGTADRLRLQIITGDERFVNAARAQGVKLNAIVIPPARFRGR